MMLCANCYLQGYCCRLRTQIVGDDKLENADYVRDFKAFCHSLGVNDEDWLEFLTALYRDYPGWIADEQGREVFLEMEEFERPFIREWFRDFCCRACAANTRPRVRTEAVERVRILATILTASFPEQSVFWGMRADNDNEPR